MTLHSCHMGQLDTMPPPPNFSFDQFSVYRNLFSQPDENESGSATECSAVLSVTFLYVMAHFCRPSHMPQIQTTMSQSGFRKCLTLHFNETACLSY